MNFEALGDTCKEAKDGKHPGADLAQYGANKILFAFIRKCGKV